MVLVPAVAVGASGVPVRVGDADNTTEPVPVDDVTPVPPLAIGKVPVTPVVSGKPVALVNVAAEGVPRLGVVKVGLLERTTEPVPVEVVTPVPPLATGRVPVTPLVKGKPVALVKVADVGVPSTGVTKVGDVDNTTDPVPVEVVVPVPPLATGKVPVTPVVRGKPVALVSVAAEGVPRLGVTRVGLLANTFAPVPVSSVKAAAKFALEGVAKKVATLEPSPEIPVDTGRPVQLVRVPEAGVPRVGVVKVGDTM